jgi:hypothetical protein
VSSGAQVGVCITEVGTKEEEGVGSGLGSSTVGSGSSDLSGPDLVLVGPIAAHAKDALAMVSSYGGSGAYNF